MTELPQAKRSPLDVLVPQWYKQKYRPLNPATAEEVRRVFAKSKMPATADVVDLYCRIGGMDYPDNEMWRLWPLDEVEEGLADENEYGVLFSDYLLECWRYRVKANGGDTSAVYLEKSPGPPRKIAETLDDFFRQYLRAPVVLLDPGSLASGPPRPP